MRCLIVVLLLVTGSAWVHVTAQSGDSIQPSTWEAHVRARAERDAERMFPQTGVGGDDQGRVSPNATTASRFEVPEGVCPNMTAHIVVPDNLPEGRKVALMFVFHGNGDPAAGRVRNTARVTTARDPVITVGVQYQMLTEEGRGRMNNPLVAPAQTIFAGCRWVLDKVRQDYAIDPERIFVGGFSMGTAWASNWSIYEWRENREAFPFRAVFLFSSAGAGSRETAPPIPVICTVGEGETAILGTINVVANVRQYCNMVAHWGVPIQYHEIPGMEHNVNGRCHQLVRDVINQLGGPGLEAPRKPENGFSPEPVPLERGEDPLVNEIIALCEEDAWQAALQRVVEIREDRDIPARDKRSVRNFDREIERVARREIRRVHDDIRAAIRAESKVSPYLLRRLEALCEAYDGENWVREEYAETIAYLRNEYPLTLRLKEREEAFRSAVRAEATPGQRAAARRMYEELAARDAEDGGCLWPEAAKFRLSWWIDGDS